MKKHEMAQKISSWYIPMNLQKIFFQHHMLMWQNRFYCFLCDEILLDCETYKHTSLKTHTQRLQAQQPKKLTLQRSHVNISYESLMSNSAVMESNNKVSCKICNVSAMSLKTFVAHIAELSHEKSKSTFVEALEHRFNGTMHRDSNGKSPASKVSEILSANVPTCEEKRSYFRKQHGTAAWCMPINLQKIFFQHHMLMWQNRFYCFLCDEILVDCETYKHTSLKTHTERLQAQQPQKITLQRSHVNISYELLMSNSAVMESNNKVSCKICNVSAMSLKTFVAHIAELSHEKSKSTFVEALEQRFNGTMHRDSNGKTPARNDSGILSAKKDISRTDEKKENSLKNAEKTEETLSNKYTVWYESKSRGYCRICDYWMSSQKNTETHMTGPRHVTKLNLLSTNKIELKDKNIYHCEICDIKIVHIANVDKHINLVKHMCAVDKLKKIEDQRSKNVTAKIPKPIIPIASSVRNLSNDYMLKTVGGNFRCVICRCTILGGNLNAEDHVSGKSHAAAFLKYGCDNIDPIEAGKNNYFCKCCQCEIAGTRKLWVHTLGTEHCESIKIGEKEIGEEKRPTTASSNSTKFKTRGKKVSTRAANAKGRIMRMIAENQMKKFGMKTMCNVCKLILPNAVKLHTHFAKYFVEDVFVSDDACENLSAVKYDKFNRKTVLRILTPRFMESVETILIDDDDDDEEVITVPPKYTERNTSIENVADDELYSMRDKLRDFELSIKLFYVTSSQKIYCIVCQITTIYTEENYLEHLYDLDHCVRLERMQNDDEYFHPYPEQFSELRLGLEYMVTRQEAIVYCYVCDKNVEDTDEALNAHIEDSLHGRSRQTARKAAITNNRDRIISSINCNWYKVQRYHCVLCCKQYKSQANFVHHLSSKDHSDLKELEINAKRQLIFDFCEACALLWYGTKRACAYHRQGKTHIWCTRDGHFTAELPKRAKDFLAEAENCAMANVRSDASAEKRQKEKLLVQDLEMMVKPYCQSARAHIFGCQVSGIPPIDTDLEVFLDCGKINDENIVSTDALGLVACIRDVREGVNAHSIWWEIIECWAVWQCPSMTIKHLPTGLSCGISVGSGLSIEKNHLLRYYNREFPLCQGMVLFLERWMTQCKLTGPEFINNDTLYWHVIFYLQQESILPSVTKLIETINESHENAEWEVAVPRETDCEVMDKSGLGGLLLRFFEFWSNFDYRHDVACPLSGKILKKSGFHSLTNLPHDICPYIVDMKNTFDLRGNVFTEEINKVFVSRFRKYCSSSFDILRS